MRAGRVLVSACLAGEPVRYDGTARTLDHPLLARLAEQGRLVTICPELAGGFSTPRPPAEIAAGRTGADVLAGRASIIEKTGADVTALYRAGAELTLSLALAEGCVAALLMDGSPSCGSTMIHDGTFQGITHPGEGITAALLRQHGIAVFSHRAIDDLARHLGG